MKFYTLLTVFFSTIAFAQVEIGYPIEEIKKRYERKDYEIKEWIENDGSQTLSIKVEEAYFTYYFEKENYKLSNSFVVTPFSLKELQKYIQYYDSKYNRVNSTSCIWKVVTGLSDELAIEETITLAKMTAESGEEFYTLIWSIGDLEKQ